MELLRFATAGSVDDGKSTLIGRLLLDTKQIFEDQLEAVERTSRDRGFDYTNLALLTDGLRAEREQGITIDVAYRYFATPRRKFIIADTPGPHAVHAQHGHRRVDRRPRARAHRRPQGRARAVAAPRGDRVAAAGASTSCCASTRWTSSTTTRTASTRSAPSSPTSRPSSRSTTSRSSRSRRCTATTSRALAQHAVVRGPDAAAPPRARLHRLRPQPDRRPLPGAVRDPADVARAPRLPRLRRPGGERHVPARATRWWCCPSGFTTTIAGIDAFGGPVDEAFPPMSVSIRLADDIDVSRGDMICRPNNLPTVTQDVDAMVCWMAERRSRRAIATGSSTRRARPGAVKTVPVPPRRQHAAPRRGARRARR